MRAVVKQEKKGNKMSREQGAKKHRFPSAPRVKVLVTKEHIAAALPANSGHCMVADAIRDALKDAGRAFDNRTVSVDLQTCRFSDPTVGFRYWYLTPRSVMASLCRFDQGALPEPFGFELRGGSVARMGGPRGGHPLRKPKDKGDRGEPQLVGGSAHSGTIPRRVGGAPPPQMRARREFGVRAFDGLPPMQAAPPSAAERDKDRDA